MANSNPWFWGGKTRQQFETELMRDAVLLRSGNKTGIVKPKVDIEAVRARKNALVKSGMLKATNTLNANVKVVGKLTGESK